jgi:predicted nucleic acid-binding protein
VIGLDTSVTVRLLIGEPPVQAEAARALVAANAGEVFVSDLVASETYFALRHHYEVPHAEAAASLRALLEDRRIRSTGVALDVLRENTRGGPGLADRFIHADYLAQGMELRTFDRAAARLSRAKLIA